MTYTIGILFFFFCFFFWRNTAVGTPPRPIITEISGVRPGCYISEISLGDSDWKVENTALKTPKKKKKNHYLTTNAPNDEGSNEAFMFNPSQAGRKTYQKMPGSKCLADFQGPTCRLHPGTGKGRQIEVSVVQEECWQRQPLTSFILIFKLWLH